MYAILETGGKQYTVKPGDLLYIEKLDVEADAQVIFDKVLAYYDDKTILFGTPYLEGTAVAAKVIKNGKGKKIEILTYRSKKDSKRKMGHRQPYTKVEITAIGEAGSLPEKAASAEKASKEAAPAEKAAPAAKKPAAKKPAAKKTGEAAVKKPAAKKTGEAAVKKTAAKKTGETAAKKTAKKATEGEV